MIYKEVKVGELLDFIKSDLYKNSTNLAITEQRAISQFYNPRATKNEIALIIAINNDNEIVGFIGSLPDRICKLPNIKFSWNSCWWIDQKKGKKTAIPLLIKFLKVWNNNVAFRDMTLVSSKIIKRLNKFKTIKKLNGYRYFLKFNTSEVLPKRNILFNYLKPFLILLDFIGNLFCRLKSTKPKIKFSQKQIDYIDDEAESFINNLNKNELFKRSTTELNWILKHPWIIEKSKNKQQYYYFSDASKNFKNYLFKIYNPNSDLIGVVFMNNHNNLFKIPYVYFESENVKIILQFLYCFLKKEKAISFLTYNDLLNKEIQQYPNPFWYIKKDFKEFVIFNEIANQINSDFLFQDGDGDVVFT